MYKSEEYRHEARQVAKDARWTFWRFLPLFLGIIILLAVLGFWLNSAGLFGRTVVERKVFENSYQRSESIKTQIATDEAALAEINRQLANQELDGTTRANLEAQAAAARIRIAAAKAKQ